MSPFRVNLGGEGEELDALNQQGPWIMDSNWRSSGSGLSFKELVDAGHHFLICPNTDLSLPDECCDEVITNHTPPPDSFTHLGPTVQTSEVMRILKRGGAWVHNGKVKQVKP